MTNITKSNIYANIPASAKNEITEILANSGSVRIESFFQITLRQK